MLTDTESRILRDLASAREEREAVASELVAVRRILEEDSETLSKTRAAMFGVAAVCQSAARDLIAGDADTTIVLTRLLTGLGALSSCLCALDPPPFN